MHCFVWAETFVEVDLWEWGFSEDFLIACSLATDGEKVDMKDKKKLFKPNFLKQNLKIRKFKTFCENH